MALVDAATLLALAALLATTGVLGHNGMDHSQGQEHSSDTCISSPTDTECVDYMLGRREVMHDLYLFCSPNATNARGVPVSMPWMTGCHLMDECGLDINDAEAAMAYEAEYTQCEPFNILDNLCRDMPGMAGCARYKPLCLTEGTAVAQCLAVQPIVNGTELLTVQLWTRVQMQCAYFASSLNRTGSDTDMMPEDGDGMHSMHDSHGSAALSGRRLLHAGEDHGKDEEEFEADQLPAVPEALAACNSCRMDGQGDIMSQPLQCFNALQAHAALCTYTTPSGDDEYDALCDPWAELCATSGEVFLQYCP